VNQYHGGRMSGSKIAQAADLGDDPKGAGSRLSRGIRHPAQLMKLQRLQDLDEAIAAVAPDLERTGGLSSFILRLQSERPETTAGQTAYVPPSWREEILKQDRPGEFASLMQGSALLSVLRATNKMPRGIGRYQDELTKVVDRLVLISVAPPTARNVEAQILLGGLASYAFGPIHAKLEDQLRKQPLGFRVWRAVTKTVKISASKRGQPPEELRAWIARLLRNAKEIRGASLYPGRSLDLELAITVPTAWCDPDNDWVADALLERAKDSEATIRERGTAALGLWQRVARTSGATEAKVRHDLEDLACTFRDEAERPDAATGLRWVAETIEDVLVTGKPICQPDPDTGRWPGPDEPWKRNVVAAAKELDTSEIPDHLVKGTKRLFEHILLQNSGVYRRQAIEAVTTGGWNVPVARAMGQLLRLEEEESWLRIRALFALGFLQVRNGEVVDYLTVACRHAYKNLKKKPTRAQITEMHAALFAVGDCFGASFPDPDHLARTVRHNLEEILPDLTTKTSKPRDRWPAARAAAYMLTFTAQDREKPDSPDLSQKLLEQMHNHPDPLTNRFAQWAISFRFGDDGQVRPLLEAATVLPFSEPPRLPPRT
jgi:hypothetical protein